MAAKRIPQLDIIAGGSTASDDQLVIFDTNEDKTKRILRSQFAAGVVGDLPFSPVGFVAAATLPTAVTEIVNDLIAAGGAAEIGTTPAGNLIATNVQAALNELDAAKQPENSGLTDISNLAKDDGNFIVGDGANWVAESGATARTSLGLGTGDSPQFTAIELGAASDTTITRVSAGVIAVEGSSVLLASNIGSTVQGYDADTAKYDDVTANFTGTLQNGGSNVLVDTDIGSTVQGYDADTAKTDTAQTFTAQQTMSSGLVLQVVAAADISAIANSINTTNKIAGKVVYDSTNHRLMVADGSGTGDSWYVVDGSTFVTPA